MAVFILDFFRLLILLTIVYRIKICHTGILYLIQYSFAVIKMLSGGSFVMTALTGIIFHDMIHMS